MKKGKQTFYKEIMKFASMFLLVLVLITSVESVKAAGKTYDLGGDGWTMRLDNPGMDSKPYYHVHFYQKGKQKYCLRLDNLKPCDSYKDNPVPKSIMKKAKNKLGDKWGYDISQSTIDLGKGLLVLGASLLVVVATICPFDGAAGDVVAWGLLLGVI